MNSSNRFVSTAAIVVVSTLWLGAAAQAQVALHGGPGMALAQAGTTDTTDGEIRKVDKDTRKITIRHGDIKHLDMPAMTMLFQVKDAAMLDAVKPGDKVKFKAEKLGSGIVLTEIRLVK